VVFSESYIQAPVQVVFDTPVFSDGLGNGGGLVSEAGDEIGGFSRGLAINFPLPKLHAIALSLKAV